VTDFRDAWTSDPMLKVGRRYLRKAHARLEAFVINTANTVTSTNPYVTSDFRARYPDEPREKWVTIFNGFDAADYSHMRSYHRHLYEGKFAIVFTGRLYGERSPFHFLLALRSAFDEEPDMRSNTAVVFVGLCERFLDGRTVEEYAERLNLSDVVELKGHISRMQSLEYQVEASVLLLLIGIVDRRKAFTYGISGKVFDYLASERPILALAEMGASRAFLVENQLATVFSHGDEQGIRQYLLGAYRVWRRG
jgi:glycosyltransferase involved in cell wall biosynthesis